MYNLRTTTTDDTIFSKFNKLLRDFNRIKNYNYSMKKYTIYNDNCPQWNIETPPFKEYLVNMNRQFNIVEEMCRLIFNYSISTSDETDTDRFIKTIKFHSFYINIDDLRVEDWLGNQLKHPPNM